MTVPGRRNAHRSPDGTIQPRAGGQRSGRARFPAEPPACYRASWQLPGPDFHRQATTSLRTRRNTMRYVTVSPPVLLGARESASGAQPAVLNTALAADMVGRAPWPASRSVSETSTGWCAHAPRETRLNHHSTTADTAEPRDSQQQSKPHPCDLANTTPRSARWHQHDLRPSPSSPNHQDHFPRRLTWGLRGGGCWVRTNVGLADGLQGAPLMQPQSAVACENTFSQATGWHPEHIGRTACPRAWVIHAARPDPENRSWHGAARAPRR